MNPNDGKIRPSFEVHCPACERPALGLAFGRTIDVAEAELRTMGWHRHRVHGWCCDGCHQRMIGETSPDEWARER